MKIKKFILVLNNHGLGDVVMSFVFFENLLNIEKKRKIIVLFKSNLEKELFILTKFYNENSNRFILLTKQEIKKVFIYIFRIEYAFSLGINENLSEKFFKFLFIKKYVIANPYSYEKSQKEYIVNNEKYLHKVELYSKLLNNFYNMKLQIEYKDFFIEGQYQKFENYIVLCGGSGEKEKFKRWPVKEYTDLVKNILENTNLNIVFVGSQNEQKLVDKILKNIKSDRIFQLNGKTNLLELIAVLRTSKVIIGNDNGILHIASAINAKIIGIFAPTNYKITGPYGTNINIIENKIECSPCYPDRFFDCKNNICMKTIKSKIVFYKIKEIINETTNTKF